MGPEFDYVVVGGGIGGCVVASRLRQHIPAASILLVEAGPDVTENELVKDGRTAFVAMRSDINWKYPSVPQEHLGNRAGILGAGRALGGSSAINTGAWVRGASHDYDRWASLVKDDRWSYRKMLKYFRKIETYHDPEADPSEHGFDGPISTQTSKTTGRHYPLSDKIKAAWKNAGVAEISDANKGNPLGLVKLTENWRDGKRQLASVAYPLDGIDVLTETLVKRILVEDQGHAKVAVGIELADGTSIEAKKEVILCAGAYRTPQVLMLSGIGPKDELSRHGIATVVHSPSVGRNLHDHLCVSNFWKLRHPELGLAVGSEKFDVQNAEKGLPMDWIVTESAPYEGLKEAISADDGIVSDDHPQLSPERCHLEYVTAYLGVSEDPPIQPDGTHLHSIFFNLLPTSRGTITLNSADPNDYPAIDNNYLATQHDRFVLRTGLRRIAEVMLGTDEGRYMVAEETPPIRASPLRLGLPDEELDDRVRNTASTFWHPGGTAAMGKVVDTELRVIGVNGLRVVDASVLPLPLAAHYQVCVYALAEQAVDMMIA